MPPRLRAQYPQEMTIVLQHQFWDLKMDEEAGLISVGLSFGGVPSTLAIPIGALVAFADPHIRYGMRFRPEDADDSVSKEAELDPASEPEAVREESKPPQVVSLDAFRRRSPKA